MNDQRGLVEGIQRLVAREHPGATEIHVDRLRRAGAGASTENWLFDAQWHEGDRVVAMSLVLRRAPANEVVTATRENEFHLLRSLEGTGLPAPEALWMDGDGSLLGRPSMVLGQCPGRADRNLLNAHNLLGLDTQAQRRLAQEMVDTLCAIHRVAVASLAPGSVDAGGQTSPAQHELDRCQRDFEAECVQPEPEMQLAAWWLRDHRPSSPAKRVLVHGDFRPANVLVENGRLTAVLDWELAHAGDPAEDLGWYLASIYRHEHFIPLQWTPSDFVARYEAVSGTAVDRAALRFWSVFALYKLATIAFATTRSFVRGDSTRLGVFPHHLMAALMQCVAGDDDWDRER